MRHADEIRRFITERLGLIYDRPMMYGGSAEGVELIIHYYHELLSFIEGCHERYRKAERDVQAQEGCDAFNFATRFRRDHAGDSEFDAAAHVVEQWLKIDARLKIEVERGKVSSDFPDFYGH